MAAEEQRDSALAALKAAEGAKLAALESAAGLTAEKAALDGQVRRPSVSHTPSSFARPAPFCPNPHSSLSPSSILLLSYRSTLSNASARQPSQPSSLSRSSSARSRRGWPQARPSVAFWPKIQVWLRPRSSGSTHLRQSRRTRSHTLSIDRLHHLFTSPH